MMRILFVDLDGSMIGLRDLSAPRVRNKASAAARQFGAPLAHERYACQDPGIRLAL
jgi:hypothetical protein